MMMARDGYRGSSNLGRTTTYKSSDAQLPPEGDARHRVNTSVKLYIANLVCGTKGCTLNMTESAERVRLREHGQTTVRFEGDRYALKRASELHAFLSGFLARGVTTYVGGVRIEKPDSIEPFPFIYVVAKNDYQAFMRFHPITRPPPAK